MDTEMISLEQLKAKYKSAETSTGETGSPGRMRRFQSIRTFTCFILLLAFGLTHSQSLLVERAYVIGLLGNKGLGYSWAIPTLIQALDKGDERLRHRAEALLEKEGEKAVPALIDTLWSENNLARRSAVRLLIKIQPVSDYTLRALSWALQDEDPTVASNAAKALSDLAPRSEIVLNELTRCVLTGHPLAAKEAANLLVKLGPRASASIPVLVRRLTTRNTKSAAYCEIALLGMGKPAATELAKHLSADEDVNMKLLPVLYNMGDDGANAIVAALSSDNTDVKIGAAFAYSYAFPEKENKKKKPFPFFMQPDPLRISSEAARSIDFAAAGTLAAKILVQLKMENPASTDCQISDALARLPRSSAPLLIGLLGDANGDVRAWAVATLWTMDKDAAPAIAEAVVIDDSPLLPYAILQVVLLGQKAQYLVPEMLKAMARTKGKSVGRALGVIVGFKQEAVTPLCIALKDPNPKIRVCAASALGELKGIAASALTNLDEATHDVDNNVRAAAQFAIDKITASKTG